MKNVFRSIRKFFSEYKMLAVVLVMFVVGLTLDLTGNDTAAHWVLGVSAIVATIPLIWDMIQSLRSGQYGLDILAVTAIVTAVIMGEYWAGMIIVLMLTGGEALEDYAERRAKKELTALLKRKPTKAHLLKGTTVSDITIQKVQVGDKLMIYPGEVVPVDCQVIEGTSSFDESSLTGESLPVTKNAGENLLSGSVNIDGAVTVKTIRIAADSQYQQIIKLVQSSAASQAPFVRMADRYSIPFTAIAFLIAGTAWILSGDSKRFLEVLVVATPCPLLLGAPIALISGMSRSAKNGIIVKTGSALERLAAVETVGFDKTGTLTKGIPEVARLQTYHNYKADEVLLYTASIEQNSTHILARSIVSRAEGQGLKLQKVKQVKETSGLGLTGRLQGKTLHVGRLSYMQQEGVTMPAGWSDEKIKTTATYVAINGELAGVITFIDEVRPESKTMLQRLRSLGIKHTLMVTGDNQTTADVIAKDLGITEVVANCLPADKIRAVEGVKHKPVAFVGDGVNDAPVLTAADVGIALGARGSTAASESADVVIMLDDVGRVAKSVDIAKRTFFIAKQSIMIGISISVVLMLIFSTGKFRASTGAAIQELVDVTVIINALRAHSGGRKSKKPATA